VTFRQQTPNEVQRTAQRLGLLAAMFGFSALIATAPALQTQSPAQTDGAALDRAVSAALEGSGPAPAGLRRQVQRLAPETLSAAALLAELERAQADQDLELASALARLWLDCAGVDGLLAEFEREGRDEARSQALVLLLVMAVESCEHDPESLAPWTASTLIDGALERLGLAVDNARVLFVALASRGHLVSPEQLLWLAAYQADPERCHPDAGHQWQTLHLMQNWAPQLPAGVEAELDAALLDPARNAMERARAGSLLLHRNWRAHLPTVLGHLATLRDQASPEDLQNVEFLLARHVEHLPSHERGEFLLALAGDFELFSTGVTALPAADAARLSAQLSSAELGSLQHAKLRLQAGGPEAIEAGLELWSQLRGRHEAWAPQCLGEVVRLGGASDPRVYEALAQGFESRAQPGSAFWRGLGWHPAGLDDRTLEHAVVPWLLLSVGERHSGRDRLVAQVQQRFPGRYAEL
jgi:hypothetical protein